VGLKDDKVTSYNNYQIKLRNRGINFTIWLHERLLIKIDGIKVELWRIFPGHRDAVMVE